MGKYHRGAKFGDWTVTSGIPCYPSTGSAYWCRCKCGYLALVQSGNLGNGATKGCWRCGIRKNTKVCRQRATKRLVDRGVPRKNIVRLDGGRVAYKPECVLCKSLLRPRVAGQPPVRFCPKCVPKVTGLSVTKYPVPLRVIANHVGHTKQRIHQVVKERGFDGMRRHYGISDETLAGMVARHQEKKTRIEAARASPPSF